MKPIVDLFRFCEISYDEPIGKESLFDGCLYFRVIDSVNDYCYIAEFDEYTVVCFRGTDGDIGAWVNNFDVIKLERGKFHNGFYDSYKLMEKEIEMCLKRTDLTKKLYVVGHSRGGALACMCSYWLIKRAVKKELCCFAYGMPAQGNKEYRNEFNLMPIDCTCVVNGYDMVPNLPPKQLGFRHVGKTYWLSQPIWHKLFCKIKDHLPKSYSERLKNWNRS